MRLHADLFEDDRFTGERVLIELGREALATYNGAKVHDGQLNGMMAPPGVWVRVHDQEDDVAWDIAPAPCGCQCRCAAAARRVT